MPPSDRTGLFKLGGVGFVASGLLFLLREILDLMAGRPPSSGQEILAWVGAGKLFLSLGNEVLFFAGLALVPAVIALYLSLADVDRAKAATGCGIMAVVIPVLAVLGIVHGRLVYPVYGIHIGPAVAEYIIGAFYGGLHAVRLLLAIATVVLSLAMRRGVYGAPIAFLGFTAAASDLIGAYGYALGPIPALITQVVSAAWFVAVGLRLYRLP